MIPAQYQTDIRSSAVACSIVFSGNSVNMASVTNSTLETETTFSSAIRTTLVGSMILDKVQYSECAASNL